MQKLAICLALTFLGACQPRTEIMVGIVTELRAPDLIDQVSLTVLRDGVPIAFEAKPDWHIADGKVGTFVLPGSYGLFSPDGSTRRVEVTVNGIKNGNKVIERKALVSLVPEKTLFMRMGLVVSCMGKLDCPEGQTCIEGECKDEQVDARMLPLFTRDSVDHVTCDSGSVFINTVDNTPMPPLGDLSCAGPCIEGTCYEPVAGMMPGTDGGVEPASTWTPVPTPPSAASTQLHSVWSVGTEAFTVGDKGTILHLTGGLPMAASTWVDESPVPDGPPLYAIAGSSPDDLYAVGAGSTILHRTVDGWAPFQGEIQPGLLFRTVSIAGSNVIIAGESSTGEGVLFHHDGISLQSDLGLPAGLPAIYASAVDALGNITLVGGNSLVAFRASDADVPTVNEVTGEMAYLPGQQRSVLFAGPNSVTGEWNGAAWTLLPNSGPPARLDHALAFDGAGILMFGGADPSTGMPFGDTWIWNGQQWMSRVSGQLSARSGHAMTYDSARNRVVLVGGSDALGMPFPETWEWNGSGWLPGPTGAPARRGIGLAYDAALDRTVLFGGSGFQSDTWLYDGGKASWSPLITNTLPPGRTDPGMAYDAGRQRVVMFGGFDTDTSGLGDTWEFDGTDWTQVAINVGPQPRGGVAMAYDAARGRTVMFGGQGFAGGLPYTETWEWDGKVWTQVSPWRVFLDSAVKPTLQAVWRSGNTAYAAAGMGLLGHLLPTPMQEPSGTESDLFGIWGSSATDLFAVGANGTILHSTGDDTWVPQPSSTTATLTAVFGSGPTDVWAVGANGLVLHSNGFQ